MRLMLCWSDLYGDKQIMQVRFIDAAGMEKIRIQKLSIPPIFDLEASPKTAFLELWSG